MRVQVLHHRDPDSECAIEVFVDGIRMINVEVEDIDPGRGYSDDVIAERRAQAIERANHPTATEYDIAVAESVCEARFETFAW